MVPCCYEHKTRDEVVSQGLPSEGMSDLPLCPVQVNLAGCLPVPHKPSSRVRPCVHISPEWSYELEIINASSIHRKGNWNEGPHLPYKGDESIVVDLDVCTPLINYQPIVSI